MERQGTLLHLHQQQVDSHETSNNYTSFEPSTTQEGKAETRRLSSNASKLLKQRISQLTGMTAKDVRANLAINESHPTTHALKQSPKQQNSGEKQL